MQKVLKYLEKKRNKSSMKKFCYKCRKQVAEKRLRIKGRFVTRQQAFEILGITYDELKGNDIIQRLLESHAAYLDGLGGSEPMRFQLNSLFESDGGKKQIKIRNFQALIDDNYNHNSKATSTTQGPSNARGETEGQQVSGAVPEELLRQIQLNLRISTSSQAETVLTKVLISGDSSLSQGADDALKLSLSNLRLEGYVQPLFKVERMTDPKKL